MKGSKASKTNASQVMNKHLTTSTVNRSNLIRVEYSFTALAHVKCKKTRCWKRNQKHKLKKHDLFKRISWLSAGKLLLNVRLG